MGEIREERGEATPVPIDHRADETSRVELVDQNALLTSSESDYVVELTDVGKTSA